MPDLERLRAEVAALADDDPRRTRAELALARCSNAVDDLDAAIRNLEDVLRGA